MIMLKVESMCSAMRIEGDLLQLTVGVHGGEGNASCLDEEVGLVFLDEVACYATGYFRRALVAFDFVMGDPFLGGSAASGEGSAEVGDEEKETEASHC